MPGKARRVASRQAQLSRRRKRQQKGASPMPPLEPVADETDGNHAAVTEPPVCRGSCPCAGTSQSGSGTATYHYPIPKPFAGPG